MSETQGQTAALIAVRRGTHAKSRLAGALDSLAREELVRALLARIAGAAQSARGIDHVFIVSPQCEDLPAGCSVILDDGSGHSAAVTRALRELTAQGIAEVLILPADLPRVTSGDLEALLAAGRDAGAAISPDHHGTGTNAFYLRLPVAMVFSFGPGSSARHRAALHALGLEPAVVMRPGLAYDIDEPRDLEHTRENDFEQRVYG